MIQLTINNQTLLVSAASSVLQACVSAGIPIPHFCYHKDLSVAGSCRMCLVEIQKSPKPVVSCAMPVTKGMVLFTNTPLVKKAREAILEALLLNHPLDCPICDQGGECDLQDETLQYGSDRGRYYTFKRPVEDKECGPIIKTIMTRCIHCTRCIRFSSEVAGFEGLGAFGRGKDMEIGTYIQTFIATELSGNLVDLCPVGALTSKPYAYKARSWELQNKTTIDFFDGVCSDIVVATRKESSLKASGFSKTEDAILRILPKMHAEKETWISDKSRYAFDGLKHSRVSLSEKSNLYSKLSVYLNVKHQKGQQKEHRLGVLFGSLCDAQGLYFASYFIKAQGGSDLQIGNTLAKANYDLPFFYSLNCQVESFEEIKLIFLIGLNTRYEASLLNTSLRKYQRKNRLTCLTLGAYAQLQWAQNHLGTSFRSLISVAENKLTKNLTCYLEHSPALLYSFESLRSKHGFFLQNIVRFLGQKFFTKTLKGERLGIVHAQIATLNFAHLGVTLNTRSPLYVDELKDKGFSTLCAVQTDTFKTKKWSSVEKQTEIFELTTHKTEAMTSKFLIPIQSLYEKEGFLFNLEGRLRKLNKVVSHPKDIYSLEVFLISCLFKVYHAQQESKNLKDLVFLCKQLWTFSEDLLVEAQLEETAPSFFFNVLSFRETEYRSAVSPFAPVIYNFYLNDSISKHSVVMSECSLFLIMEDNFYGAPYEHA